VNALDTLCRIIFILEASRASQGPLEAAARLTRDDAAADLFEDAINRPSKPLVLKGLRGGVFTPQQLANGNRRF
jgi:hypothetical protein